jgi:hypothetical protein
MGFGTSLRVRIFTSWHLNTIRANFGWLLRKHSPILGSLWLLFERLAQLLTLGRVSPDRREIIAVLADARPRPSSQ